LLVLLGDPDRNTRINAALGLARHDSAAGLPVFKDVLTELTADDLVVVEGHGDLALVKTPTEAGVAEANASEERTIAIKNVIKAVDNLAGEFTAEERAELVTLLEPLADGHPENRIRIDATQALVTLKDAK
jgi:hypothetical protein